MPTASYRSWRGASPITRRCVFLDTFPFRLNLLSVPWLISNQANQTRRRQRRTCCQAGRQTTGQGQRWTGAPPRLAPLHEPTQEEIQTCVFEIYVSEGCKEGATSSSLAARRARATPLAESNLGFRHPLGGKRHSDSWHVAAASASSPHKVKSAGLGEPISMAAAPRSTAPAGRAVDWPFSDEAPHRGRAKAGARAVDDGAGVELLGGRPRPPVQIDAQPVVRRDRFTRSKRSAESPRRKSGGQDGSGREGDRHPTLAPRPRVRQEPAWRSWPPG